MKSFALFLLFLGLAAVSMARPSAFLDDLFTPSDNSIDTALVSCNATDTCAGKGDACAGNYPGSSGCSRTNGTCCAYGLYCVNKTCMVDTEGGKCNSAADCSPYQYSNGQNVFACVNATCQYMMQVGEDCTDNSLCYSGNCNKNTSTCQGMGQGGSCSSQTDCNFGLYCNSPVNGTCQNTTAPGASCGVVPCSPGYVCFQKTFGNGSTCQQVGTQSEGMPCVPNACSSGLVCNYFNPLNMTCVTANTSSVACTANANCSNGAICACSFVTGSSYCAGPTYNDPCTEESLQFTQCLSDNNCQFVSEASDSCSMTNCESEYKKSQSCSCSLNNSQYGKCSYNQYCGGFPVWAIIVIIVVAIVLVLAIVLLVFFMMRRRRQYDSI